MDADGVDQAAVMKQLQTELDPGCLTFTPNAEGQLTDDTYEGMAVQSETLLDQYLEDGTLADDQVRQLIQSRQVFPCYFGSALKLTGIDTLMSGLDRWTIERQPASEFGARVFKVSHDEKGERLTWVRVTGGTLQPRDEVLPEQKINQLRLYNGVKYTVQPTVSAGEVCAITGLTGTRPGQGLGNLDDLATPFLQPVLAYKVDPHGNDSMIA